MGRELTAVALRGVGAGAATTRSASKPSASKDVRPVGWNISWLGCFLCSEFALIYGTTGAFVSRALWRRMLWSGYYGRCGFV